MKRPLAYITAAWLGGDSENAELAAQYCRTVYEAGFSPICPPLYLPNANSIKHKYIKAFINLLVDFFLFFFVITGFIFKLLSGIFSTITTP